MAHHRPAVDALLARQNGLLTAEQAAERGLAPRTLRRRVVENGWDKVAPRVFLAAGHPWTPRARVRAAGLWAGERGTVCGPAAAWWHGMLDRAPAVVDVTTPRHGGLRPHPGVRVRRRDLDTLDRVGIDGIWLADRPLAALETAIVVPEGSEFLDRALQRHVRFHRVYSAWCRTIGAAGSAAMGALLTAAADRADSAAERLLIDILRAAGITGWVTGLPFGRWKIDVAFPEATIAVEVDGWAWHADVERFGNDRHKGNALVRSGWELLRFTWHDLAHRPEYVVAEIRAALLRSAA